MTPESMAEAKMGYGIERPKAFIDAVVAIALTLLILPLMDSLGDAARSGDDTLTWLMGQRGQITSFLISFVLIMMFWMINLRLFSFVQRVTTPLLWLLAAWVLTIVWLPIATAVAGRMADDDTPAKILYIGSLILTSLMSLAVRLYVQNHPTLRSGGDREITNGVVVDISLVLLFTVALVIAVVFPVVGYYALLVMLLSGVVQRIVRRLMPPQRTA